MSEPREACAFRSARTTGRRKALPPSWRSSGPASTCFAMTTSFSSSGRASRAHVQPLALRYNTCEACHHCGQGGMAIASLRRSWRTLLSRQLRVMLEQVIPASFGDHALARMVEEDTGRVTSVVRAKSPPLLVRPCMRKTSFAAVRGCSACHQPSKGELLLSRALLRRLLRQVRRYVEQPFEGSVWLYEEWMPQYMMQAQSRFKRMRALETARRNACDWPTSGATAHACGAPAVAELAALYAADWQVHSMYAGSVVRSRRRLSTRWELPSGRLRSVRLRCSLAGGPARHRRLHLDVHARRGERVCRLSWES